MVYKLSASLLAHSSDVRAVLSPTDDLVLSASRDSTAVSWSRQTPAAPFTRSETYQAGPRYINSIAYIPPSIAHPQALVITGGQDTVINAFAYGSHNKDPVYSLLGHRDNVCALHATTSGTIISGSWDKTARVWQAFVLAYELVGHEQAVWAVLAVEENAFLTASADKTVKYWAGHKATRTFRGHRDAVRALALVPDIGFASCSNDSEIRVWTTEGDTVHILSGHTSFVYSLSVLPSGDIVSGGEDRTLRIWKDGSCVQTIVHPAISVWSVSSMPNGDIVSGCSDGVVRVFSETRWASEEDLKLYDDELAKQTLPSQQVGDVKKQDLPGPEALDRPGSKEGQVIMISKAGLVEAHQWNSSSMQWQKVGEVVDAIGSGRKQLYEGKEYDYVFDVDIQDGVPPLKLPYNSAENPFQAAQRFLAAHDLPLSYIDEVVKFIEKNTAGVTLGATSEEFTDPFTGASRYRASSQSTVTGVQPHLSDPFTGSSRYTASSLPSLPGASADISDPFTGSSRYTPVGEQVSIVNQESMLPVRSVLSFKQANISAMKGKLYALNDTLLEHVSLMLHPAEVQSLDESFSSLTEAVQLQKSSIDLNISHTETIIKIVNRWPPAQCFPVIDLARLICAYSPTSRSTPLQYLTLFQSLLSASEWNSPWQTPLAKHRETNSLLTLRALANAVHDTTQPEELSWINEVLSEIRKAPYTMLNQNQRTALNTLLFNVSSVTIRASLEPAIQVVLLDLIMTALQVEQDTPEAFYRGLVALGNIVYAHKHTQSMLDAASLKKISDILQSIPPKMREVRVQKLVKEIKALSG